MKSVFRELNFICAWEREVIGFNRAPYLFDQMQPILQWQGLYRFN